MASPSVAAGDLLAVPFLEQTTDTGLAHIGSGCPGFESRCLSSGPESSDVANRGERRVRLVGLRLWRLSGARRATGGFGRSRGRGSAPG